MFCTKHRVSEYGLVGSPPQEKCPNIPLLFFSNTQISKATNWRKSKSTFIFLTDFLPYTSSIHYTGPRLLGAFQSKSTRFSCLASSGRLSFIWPLCKNDNKYTFLTGKKTFLHSPVHLVYLFSQGARNDDPQTSPPVERDICLCTC